MDNSHDKELDTLWSNYVRRHNLTDVDESELRNSLDTYEDQEEARASKGKGKTSKRKGRGKY
jgi:hypothetical protein